VAQNDMQILKKVLSSPKEISFICEKSKRGLKDFSKVVCYFVPPRIFFKYASMSQRKWQTTVTDCRTQKASF
jgi:hypothetical protein